ncbi:uncharacterized protein LOC120545315 [Perca fluviatilis]|uniref:uncharacterized protein LOC120545315 n=1 Tax=Perca fluviatilis TaxID=8168 RepID=UPI001966C872|nr:uncharacterized protein LOC120545315 [Perca fluviatilis]XP_039635498.1 uncharacterized protein LOC120545315 [Perca fluviatilis]
MAATPRPRWSKNLPPDLSELMNKLINHSASFIREFDSSKQKMRAIAGEFREIADEVRKMPKRTNEARTPRDIARAIVMGAGVGIAVMALAAPFTGGATLAVVGPLAVAAGAAGGAGAARAVHVMKNKKDKRRMKKVKRLEKEFMKIVEPLKKDLEEIKRMCEKLEQRSAGDQAGKTLADMEDFQKIMTQVSGRKSEKVSELSDGCQNVVEDFDQMKDELKDFTEK